MSRNGTNKKQELQGTAKFLHVAELKVAIDKAWGEAVKEMLLSLEERVKKLENKK